MGRAFLMAVFLIGFVVFAIIKYVIVGTKAAYEAVFDPSANDERAKAIFAQCLATVHYTMKENYTGKPGELTMAIHLLTPTIQSIILDRGYQVNSSIARVIVCNAIVAGGHASQEEVDRA